MEINVIKGGVTAAKGFKVASTQAGVKYQNRYDMALIYSEEPCIVAGTFTTNVVKAAPVKYDRNIVNNSPFVQAAVVNTGIANACTGEEGMEYCRREAAAVSKALNIPESAVLVGSTGVIGMPLPMDRIEAGINAMAPILSDDPEMAVQAAKAIMTTDTHEKHMAVSFEIDGKEVHLGGMCKGSGMIHPNMCTMLSYITTDINISKELLQAALSENIKDTYNMVSVDGDTSTNDTVLLMANGLAGNEKITEKGENFDKFMEALNYVNVYLCRLLGGDGEGAEALIEVKVVEADTKENARTLARSVASSNLFKAAVYGHDANWGRIMCALGYSGAQFDPEIVELNVESKYGKIQIAEHGTATNYDEEEATKILSAEEVLVIANMHSGDCEATAWGCDLTKAYVEINADYRS